MHKRQTLGMQHQPFALARCLAAVEPVTDNRRIEPVRVRRMNAQLVGATGVRLELNPSSAALARQRAPVRDCRLSTYRIVDLTRPVVHIHP